MLAGVEFAIAYLDNILIMNENNKLHKEHIKVAFQKIDEYGFKPPRRNVNFYETNQIFGSINRQKW